MPAGIIALILLFSFPAPSTTLIASPESVDQVNETQQRIEEMRSLWTYRSSEDASIYDRYAGVENFRCDHDEENWFDGAGEAREGKVAHLLRPQHIKLIAAMGDSLIAAYGAAAANLSEIRNEYRGVSFAIGGDGDLTILATLPNFFRRFNPSLVGASHRISTRENKLLSQLNVAVSGSFSSDLPNQALELIERIRVMGEIDIENDWKLVTIFTGANDQCHFCEDHALTPLSYARNLRKSIDILQKHLPRTVVNVVPTFNDGILLETHRISEICRQLHKKQCPCLDRLSAGGHAWLEHAFNAVDAKLGCSEAYQSDNFAVIVSHGLHTHRFPKANGELATALLAPDCFHFSALAHDAAAKIMWNNLVEPPAQRTLLRELNLTQGVPVKCPQKGCPFLRTAKTNILCLGSSAERSALPNASTSRCDDIVFKTGLAFVGEEPELGVGEAEQSPLILTLWTSIAAVAVLLAIVGSLIFLLVRKKNLERELRRRIRDERTPLLSARVFEKVF